MATLSLLGVLGFTIERFVWFQSTFSNITVNGSNGTLLLSTCNQWTCTNDFIFTVVVLINLGKALNNVYTAVVCFRVCLVIVIFPVKND